MIFFLVDGVDGKDKSSAEFAYINFSLSVTSLLVKIHDVTSLLVKFPYVKKQMNRTND